MYPFERFLRRLKNNVRNKAKVEGSICNAYLVEEASSFCSYYFADNIKTRHRKCPRNSDDTQPIDPNMLSIFRFPGKPIGAYVCRWLNQEEYHAARNYILLNCDEIKSYLSLYQQHLKLQNPSIQAKDVDKKIETEFALWFQIYVKNLRSTNGNDQMIKDLATGPLRNVKVYSGYYVNGYKFHVSQRNSETLTNNSGVCVKGCSNNTDSEYDYYGILDEIIEVEYPALPIKRCVLFKCSWYDPTPRIGTRTHSNYNLIEVNANKRFNKFEPFIFAVQAGQVFYITYPTKRRRSSEWLAVCKIKPRSTIEIANTITPQNQDSFQNEEVEAHLVDSHIDSTSQLLVDVNATYEEIDDEENSSSEELDVLASSSSDEFLETMNESEFNDS